MYYDRVAITPLIAQRLDASANQSHKSDLIVLTPPATAGSIGHFNSFCAGADRQVVFDRCQDCPAVRLLVDVCFQEPGQSMKIAFRLDKTHLRDQVRRINQLFERNVTQFELPLD